ncbi:MAG TPA: hypothetical protein VI256_13560, partial [Roseiarcus sp.]
IGHVLLQDDWTVLSFPAIAEEPECVPFWTPYGTRRFIRQPGEALHPHRLSRHKTRRPGRLDHPGARLPPRT